MQSLIQILQTNPAFWLCAATLFSLLVGSFLNVVIGRLPKAMHKQWQQDCRLLLELDEEQDSGQTTQPAIASIAWPASHCPNCETPLKSWHNIPVISYLLLKGQCAFCKLPISPRYPAIELLTAVLGFCVAWVLGPSLSGVLGLVLVYFLVAMSFIDLDHKLLPDQLTLPLMWLGLILNAFGTLTSLESAVWGAIGGYMSLWLVYWGFRLATGKHGMGYGDFKLLAALGAWLGWQALPMIVLIATVTGIVVGVLLRLSNKTTDPQMPFGPFLSVGGLVYLLHGQQAWGLFSVVFLP